MQNFNQAFCLHNNDFLVYISYQCFLLFVDQQGSSNFDDSGFFSIQVIDKAIQVWGLNLVQFNSQDPVAREARQSPMYVLFVKGSRSLLCHIHRY